MGRWRQIGGGPSFASYHSDCSRRLLKATSAILRDVDLLSEDSDFFRSCNSESNLIAINEDHGNDDVVANHDPLIRASAESQVAGAIVLILSQSLSNLTLLDGFVYLPTVHTDVGRSGNPEADLVPSDSNHPDENIVVDDNRFVQLAREDQHV